MTSSKTHERKRTTDRSDDFHRWAMDQANLLRSGSGDLIDHFGLAEEIEDLGRSEFAALESDLTIIIQHILKWDRQPARRSRSWELSIREHRRRVIRRLRANPSLQSRLDEAIHEAFADARDRALAETGLADADIPEGPPYSARDIFDRVFTLEDEGRTR